MAVLIIVVLDMDYFRGLEEKLFWAWPSNHKMEDAHCKLCKGISWGDADMLPAHVRRWPQRLQ